VVKTERPAQKRNSSQKIKEGKLLRSSRALAIGGVKILPVFSFLRAQSFCKFLHQVQKLLGSLPTLLAL
jgi:hypothetical protein